MRKCIFVILAVSQISSCLYGNKAVSELNGKLEVSYGNFNSDDGWSTEGSVSMPVAESLGFQLDGLHAAVDGNEFSGGGAHFFWRERQTGLLGLSIGGVFAEVVDCYELSTEGEYYLNWVTLGMKAGYAAIEYDKAMPFIETNKKGILGLFYITAYPLDNLSFSLGYEHRFDNNSIRLDAEYQLPIDGLSLFARTMVADHDYEHALFGLRYYFGAKKSLKERHRHDDPRSIVQDVLFGLGTYGAEYNRLGNEYIKKNGGNFNFNDYGSIMTSIGGHVGPELAP